MFQKNFLDIFFRIPWIFLCFGYVLGKPILNRGEEDHKTKVKYDVDIDEGFQI